MNAWEEVKKILNEKKYISQDKLSCEIYSNHQIKYITLDRYFNILSGISYISIQYKNRAGSFIPYFALIRKIPEKLTIRDAEKMIQMPWLAWFKYGE